jgi:hypothetical protein
MPAISLSNPYSQDFDSLLNSGTSNPWTDDTTLSGWYSNRPTYNAGTGSSNAGALYSFGSTSAPERALGSVASGTTGTILYGVRLVNDTSSSISANVTPTAGVTVTQSSGSTEVNEQGESTDTYTIALNTTPAATVDIAIAATDGQTQISLDGINFFSSTTLTLNDTNPVTVTVKAIDDATQESSPHAGVITHSISSSDSNYANLSVPSINVNILDNDTALVFTKIHQIQGSGKTFDPVFGGNQTIEAIAIGDFQTVGTVQNLRGFYVQEEDLDADTNSLTSEGIFIFDDVFGVDVRVGDKVRITGQVNEFASSGSSLTQLRNITNITVVSSDNPLPTAATVDFPVASVADLEAFEGMQVTIPQTLTVTESFQLGRFGQVTLAADAPSNQPETDGRIDQYTQFNAPSVEGFAAYQAEIAKRRIVLDDGQTVQNPDPILLGRGGNPLSASNTLRGGDTVTELSGIADERFGAYRIQPTATVDFQATNPRPAVPDVGGFLKVASFNVLNYFNGDGNGGGFPTSRGAENATEFNRQRDKTIAAILGMNADVVGLIEMENDGYGSTSAIQDLVNGLNAVAGTGTYAFIDPGTPNLGTDEIAVGFIYKPGSVTPIGSTATIADGFGQGAFDGNNRKPLAQTFQENATNAQFTAVINHFKSKGSSAGGVGDADIGDGQGLSNGTRLRASQDLAAWLATNPTGFSDPDYLLIGDFNAYAQEDPITSLEASGYQNLLPENTYSFVFDGQLGSLDHALGTSSLTQQVTGAAKWHINADEPTVLDYNTNFKSANQINSLYAPDSFRSSDHDPVIVGLNLSNTINGTPNPDNLVGTSRDDIIEAKAGNDFLSGDAGNDTLKGGAGFLDRLFGGSGNDILTDRDGIGSANGGDGNDTLDLTFAANWDNDTNSSSAPRSDGKITGGSGDDTITVTMNNPRFFINLKGDRPVNASQDGSDRITLLGNYQNSVVDLGGGNDTFAGGRGSDNVSGQAGNDTLLGLGGGDVLAGGAGNDTLDGGTGNDRLIGGGDGDIFVLASGNGRDTIVDFTDGQDLIGLSGGLSFSNLTIGSSSGGTWLSATSTNEVLAVLNGVNPNAISGADFTTV